MRPCDTTTLQSIPGQMSAECASEKEIEAFISSHYLVGEVSNSYLDSEDGNHSIESLDDRIILEQLTTGRTVS